MKELELGSPLPTSPAPFSLWQWERARTLAFSGPLSPHLHPEGWGQLLRREPPLSPSSEGAGDPEQSPRPRHGASQGGGLWVVHAAALS